MKTPPPRLEPGEPQSRRAASWTGDPPQMRLTQKRFSRDCSEITERRQQGATRQYGSHTFCSFNHKWAECSSSKILHRQKKLRKKKPTVSFKQVPSHNVRKCKLQKHMRVSENKLVITRNWKPTTAVPPSPPLQIPLTHFEVGVAASPLISIWAGVCSFIPPSLSLQQALREHGWVVGSPVLARHRASKREQSWLVPS